MFEDFKPNIDYNSTYFKTINDLYILNITSYRSLKITNLKSTSTVSNCKNKNVFHKSTKLHNDGGMFVETIQDQWDNIYYLASCQSFIYINLKGSLDKKTKQYVIEINKNNV